MEEALSIQRGCSIFPTKGQPEVNTSGRDYEQKECTLSSYAELKQTLPSTLLNNRLSERFKLALAAPVHVLANLETAAPTTFHSFSWLPPEVRQEIWARCRLDPQIVRLKKQTRLVVNQIPRQSLRNRDPEFQPAVYSPSCFSPLLRTCSESRQFALKHWYRLSAYPKRDDQEEVIPYFFDPEYDWMYIGCDTCKWMRCKDCRYLLPECISINCERIILNCQRSSSPIPLLIQCIEPAKEIIILRAGSPTLKTGTQISDLEECTFAFPWQNGRSLTENYMAELLQVLRSRERMHRQYLQDRVPRSGAGGMTAGEVDEFENLVRRLFSPSLNNGVIPRTGTIRTILGLPVLVPKNVERIWTAQLIPSSSTTDLYGFMEESFAGRSFSF